MFLPGSFILLVAPPAWGKTHLFRQWLEEHPRPFLYVAPLRALVEEVRRDLAEHPGHLVPRHSLDGDTWRRWARPAPHARVVVVTPEQLGSFPWEDLASQVPAAVVVWDELHLVPTWGESFRETLLEQWWGYCASGLAGVGLTATWSPASHRFLRESLAGHFETLMEGDAGNYAYKCAPKRWLWGPRPWLEELLREAPAGRTLVFCAHRAEVDRWVARFTRRGLATWGCKGGETVEFRRRLSEGPAPRVIVATSCLSHGINLPSLDRVVLLDAGADPDFAHQMATRAGRRGEDYEVWCVWGGGARPASRGRALLTLAWRVMMGRLRSSAREWWHGARGPGAPGDPPERT